MEKFVIIDGTNLLFRAFYALPLLTNFEGEYSNAVFGFTNMLVKVIKEVQPDYLAVALDTGKKNFRHEMFKEYKGSRKPAPVELTSQFPIFKNLLKAMNIACVEQSNMEADDVIGCLSRKFNTQNIIVSADKDCLQLINKNTSVLQPVKGVTESVLYDEKRFKEEWGIDPIHIIDYKALRGDPSDNIPGVKGVGDKTAIELLKNFKTLEDIYQHVDEIKGKTQEKLKENKEIAFLSKELATILTDKELDYNLNDFKYDFPFNGEVLNYFKKYQFNSLLKKEELFDKNKLLATHSTMQNGRKCCKIDIKSELELDKLIKEIPAYSEVALYFDEKIFSVSFDEKEYNGIFENSLFVQSLDYATVLNKFKDVLESKQINKVLFDSKDLKHKLQKYGISVNNVVFDVSVARYILNTGGKPNVCLENVLDENLLSLDYCAFNLLLLKEMFSKKIKDLNLQDVFYEIEMPLIDVLYDMEITGFKIDENELNALEEKYKKEIDQLINNIYEMVGVKFNINSPKQLGEILFDKLKLESFNNKKKSTSGQILNEIKDQHPVVEAILRYRQINKLYTTYVLAFKQLIDSKTHKIYTIFNQTLTSTGRLSSSEPNLQNIPVRTDEGKAIRKIFIPSFENGYIVGADYSQIELRLLANFSGDERMIDAYNKGIDIHALTASEIFGVPVEEVSPEQRREAKAVNFGIVYGISDYGLSLNINSSVGRAGDYIKRYFIKYPKIEEYMKQNVEYCKQNGFVKTMFGRIRYIPEIKSSGYMLRQFGERAAMNMPLQGSASDIIKLAMIMVFNEFNKKKLKSKLILQVHDELIVDTHPDELETVKSILKECMENVVNLKVNLDVNIDVGKNWFEA